MNRVEKNVILGKSVKGIENLIVKSRNLPGDFYFKYLSLSEKSRERFRKELEEVLLKELLGEDFYLALAKDVIRISEVELGRGFVEKVEYNIETEVFRYLKRRLYKGNSRELISRLQSVLNKEKKRKGKK